MQQAFAVPGCPGTTVTPLPGAHGLQFLQINMEKGGRVPLHSHACAATMIVTHGTARKLLAEGKSEPVKPGDVICKAPHEPHGFDEVGPEGFAFVSISDGNGIVQGDEKLDIKFHQ